MSRRFNFGIAIGTILLMGIFAFSMTAFATEQSQNKGKPSFGSILTNLEKPPDGWTFKYVRTIEGYPDLVECAWETSRPPHGPLDKITLYRVKNVRLKQDKEKVLFIIPGTWSGGRILLLQQDQLFFANHGYDVYAMDFRISNLPNMSYGQFSHYGVDISPTKKWTYGLFREDIKACVDATKKISKADRVFIAGRSRGVTQMFIFASKYWQEDLKGIISQDGGIKAAPIPGVTKILAQMKPAEIITDTAAYEQAVSNFEATGTYLSDIGLTTPASYGDIQLGAVYPYAASPDPKFDTISDYLADRYYWGWGQGRLANYYGGLIDLDVLVKRVANYERYWPAIQDMEGAQLRNYDDCPFLDYDDHLKEIDIPALSFTGAMCTQPCTHERSQFYSSLMIKNPDVTLVYLDGWGHLDIFVGKYADKNVNEVQLEWMNARAEKHHHHHHLR